MMNETQRVIISSIIIILVFASPLIYREVRYNPYTPFALDECDYRNDTVDTFLYDNSCVKKLCNFGGNVGESYCEYLGFELKKESEK